MNQDCNNSWASSPTLKSIHIIITGGTIDKKYNMLTGEVDFNQTSYIPEMLKQSKIHRDIKTSTLFLKDSLDITLEDRELILLEIKKSTHKHIIITHGTDTMVESAKYISSQNIDKVVIFIGAMIPYSISNSDGLFNLGVSIGAVDYLQNGVYIAMNGKIFNSNNVYKDKKIGLFDFYN
ncbi:L-asparaginase [hydrothermal vent metagenome]|uniref:L-asparaginase n=1 Tax=hydrothermal vent metagenome TaxID=652676 RepID=A0A1W1EK02_9ZZZZ